MTIDIIIPLTAMVDSVPLDLKLFSVFFLLGLLTIMFTIGTGMGGHPIGIMGIMLIGLSFLCLAHFIIGGVVASAPDIPSLNMMLNPNFPINITVV
jgi:hypothetical protein